MSESAWTWALFFFELIGITGMWFVGKKLWWGWAIVLTHSIPWFIYSLIYGKPGFIAMSFMWWTVNFINMTKWRREKWRNEKSTPKTGRKQKYTNKPSKLNRRKTGQTISHNITPKHKK